MTAPSQPSQPPTRSLPATLLRSFTAALLVSAAMIAAAYVLWDRFGTLDPRSADIGGGPVGALVGGAVGALVAILDVGRRGPRPTRARWSLVAVLTWLVLLVVSGLREGADPFLPLATLAVAVLVLVPVALGYVLGIAVHDVRRERAARRPAR